MKIDPQMALYPIGSVARMLGCTPQVLRVYEKNRLIHPSRTDGQRRLYSQTDVERLEFVHYLAQVEKVNFAGIRVILDLVPHLEKAKWHQLLEHAEHSLESLAKKSVQ